VIGDRCSRNSYQCGVYHLLPTTYHLPSIVMTKHHSRPEDLFRAEKERALSARNSQHARLLAEAKAAFDKLMAEGQAARKSGRPRKHPLPPLKTSSSRAPVKPPPPAVIPVKAAAPAPAKPTVAVPAKPTIAKSAKPSALPVTKAQKKVAKAPRRPATSARRTGGSKSKPKAKRASRR
jgi:hypothetical protein